MNAPMSKFLNDMENLKNKERDIEIRRVYDKYLKTVKPEKPLNIKFNHIEKHKNMIGLKYGRLRVIEITNDSNAGGCLIKCRCDCNNIKFTRRANLIKGSVRSCGCLVKSNKKSDKPILIYKPKRNQFARVQ